MATLDHGAVLKMVRDTADLADKAGAAEEAQVLQDLAGRLPTEDLTSKRVFSAVNRGTWQALQVVDKAVHDMLGSPLPKKRPLAKEYDRLLRVYFDLLHPPEFTEMDIRKLACSKHVEEKKVTYAGDPAGVQPVVERIVEVVQRYCKAVGSGDFEAACTMTDSGLRECMSYKRFMGEHERAARDCGGPALEFRIERLFAIYADEESRKKAKEKSGYPEGTPQGNRRGRVLGFWIRDRIAQTGSRGAFWIAEEAGQYRIAKFDLDIGGEARQASSIKPVNPVVQSTASQGPVKRGMKDIVGNLLVGPVLSSGMAIAKLKGFAPFDYEDEQKTFKKRLVEVVYDPLRVREVNEEFRAKGYDVPEEQQVIAVNEDGSILLWGLLDEICCLQKGHKWQDPAGGRRFVCGSPHLTRPFKIRNKKVEIDKLLAQVEKTYGKQWK